MAATVAKVREAGYSERCGRLVRWQIIYSRIPRWPIDPPPCVALMQQTTVVTKERRAR